MAHGIPARLTPGEGRRFGLTVGGAFLALAGLLRWRGVPLGALVSLVLGAALILAGLAVPGRLTAVYRAWMRLGLAFSRITSPIFLGVVYYLVFTPFGVVMRLLGRNALARGTPGTQWIARGGPADRRGDMRHQF